MYRSTLTVIDGTYCRTNYFATLDTCNIEGGSGTIRTPSRRPPFIEPCIRLSFNPRASSQDSRGTYQMKSVECRLLELRLMVFFIASSSMHSFPTCFGLQLT
jgi:hypothetical protein